MAGSRSYLLQIGVAGRGPHRRPRVAPGSSRPRSCRPSRTARSQSRRIAGRGRGVVLEVARAPRRRCRPRRRRRGHQPPSGVKRIWTSVGVAEEVVKIAEGLLVGADQEDRRGSRARPGGSRAGARTGATSAAVDEAVDLPVGVAGDVDQGRARRSALRRGGESA